MKVMYDPQTVLVEQHIRDLRKEAEQLQLARQIGSTYSSRISLQTQILTVIGHRLIAWGQQLQESSIEPQRRQTAGTI